MVEKLLLRVEDIYFKRGYASISFQPMELVVRGIGQDFFVVPKHNVVPLLFESGKAPIAKGSYHGCFH